MIDCIKKYYPSIAGRAMALRHMADIATIEYAEKLDREATYWEDMAGEFFSFIKENEK